MNDAAAGLHDPISERALSFARNSIGASFAALFWIDASDVGFTDFILLDLPKKLMSGYFAGMSNFDPLSIKNTLNYERRFVTLQSDVVRDNCPSYDHYQRFLVEYDIEDEVDMLLFAGSQPIASIALHRRPSDPAFTKDEGYWFNLQSYLEFNLQFHPRVRAWLLSDALEKRFGLSPREQEVALLVSNGASNCDIAELLGIKVGTVKTHIINLLDKLGVTSRYRIMALCRNIDVIGTTRA